jgi:predicted amidophosphoribosyltransferase
MARKKTGLNKFKGLGVGTDKRGFGDLTSQGTRKGMINCSECGTEVTDDAQFCPHCGEYFEGDEFTCPGCNSKLDSRDTACPKCGKIFESSKNLSKNMDNDTRDRGVKDNKLFCSECGGVVYKNDKRCPGCNAIFEAGPTSKRAFHKPSTLDKDLKHRNKPTKDKDIRAQKITAQEEAERKSKEAKAKGKTNYGTNPESDNSYMCSICGSSVNEIANICPKCGTEFDQ